LRQDLLRAQARAARDRPCRNARGSAILPAEEPNRARQLERDRSVQAEAVSAGPEDDRVAVDRSPAPGPAGSRRGSVRPSAAETGCENVRKIGVVGEIRVPGRGLSAALASVPTGNQLSSDGAGRLSHARGAAATSIEPASPVRVSVI
jgi:hypothetical protein